MARYNSKRYDFLCEECHHEFSSVMGSNDKEHDGNWVPEGVDCPKCSTRCIPPNWSRPLNDNSVTDKDVRTGNWVHKLPSDWKEMNNKIVDRNRSSFTTMQKL